MKSLEKYIKFGQSEFSAYEFAELNQGIKTVKAKYANGCIDVMCVLNKTRQGYRLHDNAAAFGYEGFPGEEIDYCLRKALEAKRELIQSGRLFIQNEI